MEKYIIMIAATSIVMSGVILCLILFNRLFSDRYSAKWRYYIWIIVLFGLLIPFRPDINLPFNPVSVSFEDTEQSAEQPIEQSKFSDSTEYNISNYGDVVPIEPPVKVMTAVKTMEMLESELPEPIESTEPTELIEPMKSNAVSTARIVFIVWLIGVILSLAFYVRSYRKFISMVKRWGTDISDRDILCLLQQIRDELGISQKIQIKKCNIISSPVLAGFIKPVILLPNRHIDKEELLLILKHELIHYKRKDLWINLLVILTTAIHWFNPFVHIMSLEMRNDCEVSCDEAVLGSADTESRRIYGKTIISFAGIGKTTKTSLSTNFYGGKSTMKKRLKSIMNTNRNKKVKWIAVLCGTLIFALTFASGFVFAVTPSTDAAAEKAWETALEKTGGGTVVKCELDYLGDAKTGITVYEIEVINGNTKYEMEIGASDSVIYSYEESTSSKDRSSSLPSAGDITAEEAVEIALAKAGAGEAVKWELDNSKDGTKVYEIEIAGENIRYTMDVRASDGEIQNYKEREVKSNKAKESSQTVKPTLISAENANKIALERTGGGRIEESELDYEKGVWVYEIEVIFNRTEYDIEINAETGVIIKFEIDD